MDIIVASNNKGKLKEIKEIFSQHNVISMAEAKIDIEIEESGTTFLENALIKAKAIYQILNRPTLSDDSGLVVPSLQDAPGVYSARYSTLPQNNSTQAASDARVSTARGECDAGVQTARGDGDARMQTARGDNDARMQTARGDGDARVPTARGDNDARMQTARGDGGLSFVGGEKSLDERNNELLIKNLADKDDRRAKFVSVVVLYFGEDKYIWASGEVFGEILSAPRGSEGFGYDPLFFCTELGKTFAEASMQEKNTVSHRARALKNLAEKMTNLIID